MHKKITVLFLLVLSSLASAQAFYTHHISIVDSRQDKPKFNESAYTSALLNKYNETFRNSKSLYNYIDFLVEEAKQTHYSNYVYPGWEEAENFLLNVLKKAVPGNLVDSSVRIKVVRDPEINAYCREDGTIFMNIGFLASFNSEAEIAAVLCHELGHYLSFHSYKKFEKRLQAQNTSIALSQFGLLGRIIPRYSVSQNSKEYEEESDDYILKFFKGNAYSLQGPSKAYQLLLKMESLQKNNRSFHLPLFYLSTHPPTSGRLAKMEKLLKGGDTASSRSDFLVDKEFFAKLKLKAVDESIYLLFCANSYQACLQQSFLQHILYPDDEFYIFYSLECLRRISLLSANASQNYFIMGNYYLSGLQEVEKPVYIYSSLKKVDFQKTIFHQLNTIYPGTGFPLAGSPLLQNDTLEFVTEKEALAYFKKVAEAKCKSCFLSLKLLESSQVSDCKGAIRESDPLLWQMCDDITAIDLLKQPPSGAEKIPVFFNNIYTKKYGSEYNRLPFVSTFEMRKDYYKFTRWRKDEGQITWKNILDNSEMYQLYGQMDLLGNYYNTLENVDIFSAPPGYYFKEKYFDPVELNITKLMPEMAGLAAKYNYRKIMFFDLFYYQETQRNMNGEQQNERYQAMVYCVDLAKNKIWCAKSKYASGTGELSLDYVMSIVEPLFINLSLK